MCHCHFTHCSFKETLCSPINFSQHVTRVDLVGLSPLYSLNLRQYLRAGAIQASVTPEHSDTEEEQRWCSAPWRRGKYRVTRKTLGEGVPAEGLASHAGLR